MFTRRRTSRKSWRKTQADTLGFFSLCLSWASWMRPTKSASSSMVSEKQTQTFISCKRLPKSYASSLRTGPRETIVGLLMTMASWSSSSTKPSNMRHSKLLIWISNSATQGKHLRVRTSTSLLRWGPRASYSYSCLCIFPQDRNRIQDKWSTLMTYLKQSKALKFSKL